MAEAPIGALPAPEAMAVIRPVISKTPPTSPTSAATSPATSLTPRRAEVDGGRPVPVRGRRRGAHPARLPAPPGRRRRGARLPAARRARRHRPRALPRRDPRGRPRPGFAQPGACRTARLPRLGRNLRRAPARRRRPRRGAALAACRCSPALHRALARRAGGAAGGGADAARSSAALRAARFRPARRRSRSARCGRPDRGRPGRRAPRGAQRQGNRSREVPIRAELAALLRRYLAETGRSLGETGPLFRAHDRGAAARARRRLTPGAIRAAVAVAARLARSGSRPTACGTPTRSARCAAAATSWQWQSSSAIATSRRRSATSRTSSSPTSAPWCRPCRSNPSGRKFTSELAAATGDEGLPLNHPPRPAKRSQMRPVDGVCA